MRKAAFAERVYVMLKRKFLAVGCAAIALASIVLPVFAAADPPLASQSRIEAALKNMIALDRPGEIGLATFFEGNKYVQCRQMADHKLRCESGGARMQPSLAHVLTPEKIERLAAGGWAFDDSFGNYAQVFAAEAPPSEIAAKILRALAEGYDADLTQLEAKTDWIAGEPCPARVGPSQNLAGSINDAPALARTAIYACAYAAPHADAIHAASDLVDIYGKRVTGEIQHLHINIDRDIYVIFQASIGYVQCAPMNPPPAIYCEAQSADSWPALTAVLTPERVARLHAAGYVDPGHAPNYSRSYPLDKFDEGAVARELLTILYDVYGYSGEPKLRIITEKGG
jgi:hypothetical protein